MTPQSGPHSAGPMSGYPPPQSPMAGPSGGRTYGGFAGPGAPQMPAQSYNQMPGSAGGYGRPDQMPGAYGTPQGPGGYPSNPQNSNYSYQP